MTMKILLYPDPLLMVRTRPVETITQEVRDQVAQMKLLMYEGDGVGLAAPQVGWSARLFLMNPSGDPRKPELERVLINPRIVKRKGREIGAEGCLSFPGIHAEVERFMRITVEFLDLEGGRQSVDVSDFDARIVQHENDHLDNILLIHRMTEADKIKHRDAIEDLIRKAEVPAA